VADWLDRTKKNSGTETEILWRLASFEIDGEYGARRSRIAAQEAALKTRDSVKRRDEFRPRYLCPCRYDATESGVELPKQKSRKKREMF
jgi:hypothetical protein